MTKYSLIINPFAEKDIKDSKSWYNLQKDSLGKELQREIKETVFRVKENPLQFPKVKAQIRKAYVNKFPYIILYTINNQKINVFAVFHTSRDPNVWEKTKFMIKPNRPTPITSEIDVVAYNSGMQAAFAVEALMEGYYVLVLDFYSSGLEVLNELKHQLKQQYSNKSFKEQQKSRDVFRELSHRLLLEVSDSKISVKKAPHIGWFKKLYPDLKEFLLPFPQVQGLNSAWQWYIKGIHIPVIEKKIYPWFGTYFPTRFEHLELFDEWLKKYKGEKETAIDIGVGSGILSLQMQKYGFENIIGTDNNPNAIIGLNEYLSKVEWANKIQLHFGDLFINCPELADLIIFNPPWLPISREVEGIDKAMYYDQELFPRFFKQAHKHLKPEGKLIIIFSNLAQITDVAKSHPIEEELATHQRFKKEDLVKKQVGKASKKTKRNLSRRAEEKVELWVLTRLNQ